MNMTTLSCPRCSGSMELGVLVDHNYSGYAQPEWIEGEPKTSMLTGGLKVRGTVYEVVTYRCGNCGYLESYAHLPKE